MSLTQPTEFSPSIALGPLLGIESDSQYSVCVLIHQKFIEDVSYVELQFGDSWIQHSKWKPLRDYFYFRFEFSIQPEQVIYKEFTYSIGYNKIILTTSKNKREFTFRVPPLQKIPDMAFVSCNGSHNTYPTELPSEDFLGWENMLKFKPDYLFLTGDQVYADPIWDKIKEAKVVRDLEAGVSPELEDQIDKFYLQLYIDSWSNEFLSQALATIPNVMTWDDHEIIDGFGSHTKEYQEMPIFIIIAKYAKLYFEHFQIRTSSNISLLNYPYDYTLYLNIRNYSFIIPDTRLKRTRKQVLDERQYLAIEHLLGKREFQPSITYFEEKKNMNVICFILPVPIAHRDYNSPGEKIYGFFSGLFNKIRAFNFGTTEDDDLVDHWDHVYHQKEQKRMLDLIFQFGARFKPKNLLIVSGDVHSGGAATVYKTDSHQSETATQIITSPIVNTPVSYNISELMGLVSKSTTRISGYLLNLRNFGSYKVANITARNYVIVSEYGKRLIANMYIQLDGKWPDKYSAARTLNDFDSPVKSEPEPEPWLQ